MATGPYINAIETRLRWLRLSETQIWTNERLSTAKNEETWDSFRDVLAQSETFYMNEKFCALVAHALESFPSDLRFEYSWMQARIGWMFLETPLYFTPRTQPEKQVVIRAVAWELRNASDETSSYFDTGSEMLEGTFRHGSGPGLQVMTYGEDGPLFYPVHAFFIRDGQTLQEVIKQHQDAGPFIRPELVSWVFTAAHLMNQKLSITLKQKTDRSVIRRAKRADQEVPNFIKVISLRRMEEARTRESPQSIAWHWQWEVRGHWRNQFYPSENTHKPVFVEAYIKGPTDKPFKSPGLKLFAAVR